MLDTHEDFTKKMAAVFGTDLEKQKKTVEDFKVLHQVTGPIETNCYLIFGTKSKEAALIDPGWQVDTLINHIRNNNLKLKYVFVTHGHIDHFYYIPEIKKLVEDCKGFEEQAVLNKYIKTVITCLLHLAVIGTTLYLTW